MTPMLRLLPWVAVLALAPLVFPQSGALSLLSQMGTMILLCLSMNLLLGEGGMLSFGHAIYSGLGAFGVIHLMNQVGAGALAVPITLLPLAGGLVGALCGVLFGYLTTRRAGTTFSMITLGLVELVSAAVPMFPELFGGEGGIAGNRVAGEPVLGITYGPQVEVYALIAGWLLVCGVAMAALRATPLGLMLNAVRDNPERAAFVGYDPQRVRYLALILSAFFAGIGGGLAAINFEIVTGEYVGAARSGAILLFTFIGGGAYFYGPIIGAVVGVLFSSLLSAYTPAWQFYLGLLFIAIVLWLPGGLAQVLDHLARVLRARALAPALARCCARQAAAGLAALAGLVLGVEALYRLSLGNLLGASQASLALGKWVIDIHGVALWLVAALLLAGGIALLARGRLAWRAAWRTAWARVEAFEGRRHG